MKSGAWERPLSDSMDVDEFTAFLELRPGEEWWQLIDGAAVMMNPPTLVHQRIALNFSDLLNDALRNNDLAMYAYVDIGVRNPGVRDFQPGPDVAVVPGLAGYETHAERFHLVAEVISRSNTRKAIDLKLGCYREAPDNLYALVIDQRRIAVKVFARRLEWRPSTLTDAHAELELPEFGFRCSVSALYSGTPLDPARPRP